MRPAIPAEQRLIATLRYLATGRSLQDRRLSGCRGSPLRWFPCWWEMQRGFPSWGWRCERAQPSEWTPLLSDRSAQGPQTPQAPPQEEKCAQSPPPQHIGGLPEAAPRKMWWDGHQHQMGPPPPAHLWMTQSSHMLGDPHTCHMFPSTPSHATHQIGDIKHLPVLEVSSRELKPSTPSKCSLCIHSATFSSSGVNTMLQGGPPPCHSGAYE